MTQTFDIDNIETTFARVERKRTPMNTNPLALEADERAVIDDIAKYIGDRINITERSNHHQIQTFHFALLGIEAALSSDWAGLLAAAENGLMSAFEVQAVSSYVICKQDGAGRDLASDQRASLKELALRLGHAAPAETELEADRARCLRAMTYAAIAADRGLMHLVKDNFGVVITTMGSDYFGARSKIKWSQNHQALSQRYRNARVRMP